MKDDRRLGLRPPQFGLRTLLGVLVAASILSAVYVSSGPIATYALMLVLLILIAHVSGNALGTQLRESGDRPVSPLGDPLPRPLAPRARPLPEQFAPPSNLSQSRPLGWAVVATVLVGSLLGAAVGGGLLSWANWERLTWRSALGAAIASGVIGGILGFAASGFVRSFFDAWRQAVQYKHRDRC